MNQSQEATVAATPGTMLASRAPHMWVVAVVLGAGLGLIVLGGCFLIGVWVMIGAHEISDHQDAAIWSSASQILMFVLYGLAAACFVGAAAMFVVGIRCVIRLIKD